MPNVNEIQLIEITLTIEDKMILWIVLASDGTIHRLGSGTLVDKDLDLFIGLSKEPLFDQLRSNVTAEMLDHTGVYTDPRYQGKSCNLRIRFEGTGSGVLIEYNYGSESVGPPAKIKSLVRTAVGITNDWHQEQKRIRDLNAPPE